MTGGGQPKRRTGMDELIGLTGSAQDSPHNNGMILTGFILHSTCRAAAMLACACRLTCHYNDVTWSDYKRIKAL